MVPGAHFPVLYLWLPLVSTPQVALGNTSYGVLCGYVVGGGSVVNAMFFHRPDANFYDTCEALGARGSAWKDWLPFFKKSENFSQPKHQYAADYNITWVTPCMVSMGLSKQAIRHMTTQEAVSKPIPWEIKRLIASLANFFKAAVSTGIQPR